MTISYGGKMKRNLLPALALTTLLMAACAGPAVQKDANYKSVLDLRDAYVGSGAVKEPKCDEKITQDAKAKWGWQTVNCGMNTVLLVADAQSALDDQVAKDLKYGTAREAILVGPNWLIRGPEFEVKEVQKTLGGQVKN